MKRIITGMVCVLIILAFGNSGVFAEKKMVKGQQVMIKTEDGIELEFRFDGYDEMDVPIILDSKGNRVGKVAYKVPEDAELIISVHYKNPCYIRIGNRPPIRVPCR